MRDAEKQFSSSSKIQDMISTYLWISKIYQRLDQPKSALDINLKGIEKFSGELSFTLEVARLYDELNEISKGVQYYKKMVLI